MALVNTVFNPVVSFDADGRRVLTYTATQADVLGTDDLVISDIPTPCWLSIVEVERTTPDLSATSQPEIGVGAQGVIAAAWALASLFEVAVANAAEAYIRISADNAGNPIRIPPFAGPADMIVRSGLDAHADLITWRITLTEE